MARERYRLEDGDAAIEVCLAEPPTPELEAALLALARAAQADMALGGRSVAVGGFMEERVRAIRRRAGLPVWGDPVADD